MSAKTPSRVSRFGTQPAYDVLRAQDWSVQQLVDAGQGYSHGQLQRAVQGHTPPRAEIKEWLPRLLNTPLEQLFTELALNPPPVKHRPGKRTVRYAARET